MAALVHLIKKGDPALTYFLNFIPGYHTYDKIHRLAKVARQGGWYCEIECKAANISPKQFADLTEDEYSRCGLWECYFIHGTRKRVIEPIDDHHESDGASGCDVDAE